VYAARAAEPAADAVPEPPHAAVALVVRRRDVAFVAAAAGGAGVGFSG